MSGNLKPSRRASCSEPADAALRPLKISSRQIVLLNALDQHRNVQRAANAMHTTQPTASLLLKQLESRLGVRLFDRLPRGMEPTRYGEALIRFARNVSQDFERAETEVAELAKGTLGLLRVGSVIGAVPSVLTEYLLAYKEKHPKVRISIEVGTSDTLLPLLARGDLDLLIGRLPDGIDNDNLSIDYFDQPETMRVIARPGHVLANKTKIHLSDLFAQTWILHPIGSPMRLRVENALKTSMPPVSLDIVETTSILAMTSLIEASDMISVVPQDVATHYAKYAMVAILAVELPVSMINLGVIRKKTRQHSPAAFAFLDSFLARLPKRVP